jgi:hypothetical protein
MDGCSLNNQKEVDVSYANKNHTFHDKSNTCLWILRHYYYEVLIFEIPKNTMHTFELVDLI